MNYLNFEDRKKIEKLYSSGTSISGIAIALNVHISTIYRELARGYTGELDSNWRNGYSAEKAQSELQINFKKRGHKKLIS